MPFKANEVINFFKFVRDFILHSIEQRDVNFIKNPRTSELKLIFLNVVLKMLDRVVGSDFMTPSRSVFFQLLYVVDENINVEFDTTDSDIKLVAVEVRM